IGGITFMVYLTRVQVSTHNPVAWRELGMSAMAASWKQAKYMGVKGAFPVTVLSGDCVGPELMHTIKEIVKAAAVSVDFQEHSALREVQNVTCEEKLEWLLSCMENKVAFL
uniref:Uncharacterized protein n=1 Tax=Otolemur garnettii TaxID=30611 RepID=H0XK57_OTOGA